MFEKVLHKKENKFCWDCKSYNLFQTKTGVKKNGQEEFLCQSPCSNCKEV